MAADDLEKWLLSLPLEEPCNIDGENVYLRLGPDERILHATIRR